MHTSALAYLPDDGPPDLLYLLFHGVGATADSMLPLAQRLIREYPRAAVLCPNAPHRFDAVIGARPGEPEGRQWFSIRRVDEANRPDRVTAALKRRKQRLVHRGVGGRLAHPVVGSHALSQPFGVGSALIP